MSNVDVRQEGTVYQKRLPKMLPGRVHGIDSEDQVGRSELPALVNKYLGPEYKIQIPNVDFPEIRDKHFAVYKIYIYIYIYMIR